MVKFSKIIFICAIYLRGSVGVDWCSQDLECRGVKNTMCTYQPKTGTSAECTELTDVQTPEGRQRMLDWHNDYRNRLAGGEMPGWPKAANMRQMYWDDEIETIALRWAQQCVNGHDKCRRTLQFPYVGQNYAWSGHTAGFPNPRQNFDFWVAEIKDIADPIAMMTSFTGGSWGHFTQVNWADSYKLGCAEIHYNKNRFKTTADFCNYGPGGNIYTTNMYQAGEPASKCPPGTGPSKTYPNLCSYTDEQGKPMQRKSNSSSHIRLNLSLLLSAVLMFFG